MKEMHLKVDLFTMYYVSKVYSEHHNYKMGCILFIYRTAPATSVNSTSSRFTLNIIYNVFCLFTGLWQRLA